MTALDFLITLQWRDTVNELADILDISRFAAAELLERAWNLGYNFRAI